MSKQSGLGFQVGGGLLRALASIMGVVVVGFAITCLFPDDAADIMAVRAGSATAESLALLREHFGLGGSVLQRLFTYLSNLATLDLGFSPQYNASVLQLVLDRLPSTLLLMLCAFTVSLTLGTLIGFFMVVRQQSVFSRVLAAVLLVFYSIPGFWIGLMLIVLFSVTLGWLPSNGAVTIGAGLTGWNRFIDAVRHLVLPVCALSPFMTAVFARLTRTALLDVAGQDFMRTAWAKGLSRRRIQVRHLLRNALIPLSTAAGVSFASLLSGSIVVETVFAWPGLGRLAFESVQARDFNILLGILFLSSLLVIATNLLVDVLHGWLDPRISR